MAIKKQSRKDNKCARCKINERREYNSYCPTCQQQISREWRVANPYKAKAKDKKDNQNRKKSTQIDLENYDDLEPMNPINSDALFESLLKRRIKELSIYGERIPKIRERKCRTN